MAQPALTVAESYLASICNGKMYISAAAALAAARVQEGNADDYTEAIARMVGPHAED